MKTRAFTLIELLVVLGIIGILAGLLYPAISKVRENGRQAQCANDLKELHTAVMTFTSNVGRFPFATTYQAFYDNAWHEHLGWVGRRANTFSLGSAGNIDMWDGNGGAGSACISNGTLYAYVLDKRVFVCPTFVIEAKKIMPACTYVRSYVMNWYLNWQNLFSLSDGSKRMLFTELNTDTVVEGMNVSQYSVFSGDVEILQSAYQSANGGVLYYRPQQTDGALMFRADQKTAPVPPTEGIAAYHNGKGHVIFADGHVEFLYYSNTWDTATGNW
jgi:prepilin-type N-terminal cleavage/methylation domain-containing protein/prepilin-type processing-associated H-X9-DG protein